MRAAVSLLKCSWQFVNEALEGATLARKAEKFTKT
jgi:hypothetical protein